MEIVLIALGTNLGDRLANLGAALRGLDGPLRDIGTSPVYETAPRYVEDQPPFLNMAARAETTLEPLDLLAALKGIERVMGRNDGARNGPRLIDLDIIFYGARVLRLPGLTIPHPRLAERSFVLRPLADIAPAWRHPETGATVTEMLAPFADDPGVRLTTRQFERIAAGPG